MLRAIFPKLGRISMTQEDIEVTYSFEEKARMDRRLLQAAISGDAAEMNHLAVHEPGVLLGITPQGNNCLHIAAIHGHEGFCKDVLKLQQSLTLLTATNEDGETPLVATVIRGRESLASSLLRFCCDQQLSETILKQDKRGFNALNHAIFGGHRKLALELIEAEPALSKVVNKCYDSPLCTAVIRDYGDIVEKLLQIPDAAHGEANRCNALHAAVESDNAVIAKRIMEANPGLVRQENEDKRTPMHLAAHQNKINVFRALLEHDPSLGYLISTDGSPLLCTAATQGNVGVARELLRHCPDPPYRDANGSTYLHIAASSGQKDFVRYVLSSRQLQHLIKVPNDRGETALQLAASNDNKDIVTPLKFHLNNPSIHVEYFTSGMEQFLEAAVSGLVVEMRHLYRQVPGMPLGTTPQGNTCLHIAAIYGHEVFCKEIQAVNPSLLPSLLAAVNSDGETPLLAAVANGRVSVASVLLRCCRDLKLSGTILKQDKRGCNALHHAIRNGHRKLALEKIQAEPALSHAVNQYDESPMFIAVMRNYEDVFEKILEIPDSAHGGAYGHNALHAAVRNGNSSIATKIMETRHALAREGNTDTDTPVVLAAIWDKTDVLRVILEHDRSLGYRSAGSPLLNTAAFRGHVRVARELLKHCPDAPYARIEGDFETFLHKAVWNEHTEFIDFVLGLPESGKIINMRDSDRNRARLCRAAPLAWPVATKFFG